MAAGDIIQSKTGYVYSTAGNLVVTLDYDFTPGNTLIIVLSWLHYLKGHADSLINDITDNKSNTFTRRTAYFRIPGDYTATGDLWSEIWDCVGAADASPGTHIEVTIDPKRTEPNNIGFAYIAEVEGIDAFSSVGVQTGGSISSSSVTSTTAELTAPQIAFSGYASFASGVSSPTGWELRAANANGTNGVNAFGAASKVFTSNAAAEAIWTYTTATTGAAATISTYTLETTGTYKLKFEFDSSVFTSADTSIEGYVWFDEDPDDGPGTYYSGLSGDATAGTLYITSGVPVTVGIATVVKGIFFNATDTSGLVTGAVEAV